MKHTRKNITMSDKGLCRVKDLVEYLKQFDQDAYVLYCEMNAFDGGLWQHFPARDLNHMVKTVAEDKKDVNAQPEDYKYANDNDIIIRI